jgi:hypothetical protein
LIYEPGKVGTQKVSASFGRYYEQFSTSTSSSSYFIPSSFAFLHFDHNPLVDPTGGDTLEAVANQGDSELKGLRGQYFDEFTVGYERRIAARAKLGVRGMYRVLRSVVEDGLDIATGNFVVGNLGKGALEWTGPPLNEFYSLGISLEGSGARTPGWLVSYQWSRAYGNYVVSGNHVSAQYDFPEGNPNRTGLLPHGRTHILKGYGSYRATSKLTVGAVLTWESGTPISEFGVSALDYVRLFLSPRGSVGRTPAIWDLGLKFAYALGDGRRPRAFWPTVTLDLYHVGSPQKAVDVDMTHYFGRDDAGNQIGENPNYLSPTEYQPPMAARIGLAYEF